MKLTRGNLLTDLCDLIEKYNKYFGLKQDDYAIMNGAEIIADMLDKVYGLEEITKKDIAKK